MSKKKENLKKNTEEELKNKLSAFKENLRILHFKNHGLRSKNVKEEKNLKKEIARVLTEINRNNKKLKNKNEK